MKLKLLALLLAMATGAVYAQEEESEKTKKTRKFPYEEVDFENMMRRYFMKETSHDLEGIYSVSCVITKRKKRFLSKREKIRIVEKQDNYARIAILKDFQGAKQDFIEVSLSYRDGRKYPIIGTIDGLSEGNGYVYKHIEPDGAIIKFSMVSESSELLEGEYSYIKRRKTITYRLSYLKTFPKAGEVVVNN